MTEIDGLDVHVVHVRSKHDDALLLIVTHGWPGSVVEQLRIVDPPTDPTAHGASASNAFHLVIPSTPGYGFSGKPAATGWGPERIARALDGQPPGAARGIDIDDQGRGTASEQRLYQLIRQPKPITDRQFEIEFLDPGVEALAFTFG